MWILTFGLFLSGLYDIKAFSINTDNQVRRERKESVNLFMQILKSYLVALY